MDDEEYAVVESPERAVTRPSRQKGQRMKARLLRAYGGNYAGQIMSNVKEGDFPSDAAEYFEDDDPAINTVREPSGLGSHNLVDENGEVEPIKGSDFAKAQEAKVKAVAEEHEAQQQAQADALAEIEELAQKGSKVPTAKAGKKKAKKR
jgi:hypothetical protein